MGSGGLSCRVNSRAPTAASTTALLHWEEDGQARQALWRSENGASPPRRVLIADDRLSADRAYRLVCEGTGLLWRGDFQNARQLLQALQRRVERSLERRAPAAAAPDAPAPAGQAFHLHRKTQAQRSRILGLLLIELGPHYRCDLRRAPDVQSACEQAWGPTEAACAVPLQALQGLIGAREWYRKGVPVAELGASIHPHYGVFSPLRGEYLQLVAQAPLPAALQTHPVAMDVGTGTGVLAALLARRGIGQVLATDLSDRALACAQDNLQRLQLPGITLLKADLFAPGKAALIVCNPPWLPARPNSTVEPRTICNVWACEKRSSCCKPTCIHRVRPLWWSATRPGCQPNPTQYSIWPSMTRRAPCCEASSRAWPHTCAQAAKAG